MLDIRGWNCPDSQLDSVFPRVQKLLHRAYKLSFKSRGYERLHSLLVINNDVEEILRIIKDNKQLFRQPRIHLKPLKDVIVKTSLDVEPQDESDEHAGENGSGEPCRKRAMFDDAKHQDVEALKLARSIKSEPETSERELPPSNLGADAGVLAHVSLEFPKTRSICGSNVVNNKDSNLVPIKSETVTAVVKVLPSQQENDSEIPLEDAGCFEDNESCDDLGTFDDPESCDDHESCDDPEMLRPKSSCYTCLRLFKQNREATEEKTTELNNHLIRYHPEKMFHCDCGTYIFGEKNLKVHEKKHPVGNVVKLLEPRECPHCQMKFVSDKGRPTKPVVVNFIFRWALDRLFCNFI